MAIGTLRASRLHGFRLCSADCRKLADFYENALLFHRVGDEVLDDEQTRAETGIGGRSLRVALALGEQRLELLQFVDHPGAPYPADGSASDLVFQHFALVVSDMDAAMRLLSVQPDWTPITIDGPQQLPASSGGVTAFKFRDPEGHPLELLQFPDNEMPAHWVEVKRRADGDVPLLGIDHSAISVADIARSIAFYESIGLRVSGRSRNNDPAQSRLDAVVDAVVEVTALSPAAAAPHLELLCYQGVESRTPLDMRPNDVAATCLLFTTECMPARGTHAAISPLLRDPDGHFLSLA